jgi:hypothetical protein
MNRERRARSSLGSLIRRVTLGRASPGLSLLSSRRLR